MEFITTFFNVNTTFIHVIGYDMSYLEFFGTILNIWCVYLVTKNKILSWPIGNIAVILFAVLFFQIQLYADFFEQIYFFITGCYGWFMWHRLAKKRRDTNSESTNDTDTTIVYSSVHTRYIYLAIVAIGTLVMGYCISRMHLWFPEVFTLPASYAYLDAFTTVLSFLANIIMAHKRIECWYMWILVDIIGIGLYAAKEVYLVAILYGIFLVLATKGLLNWKKLVSTTQA